jgi:trehalose/maltose transport system substrate-binding protein
MRWLAAATAGLILAFGATAKAAEISISCSALGKEYEICKEGVDRVGEEDRP